MKTATKLLFLLLFASLMTVCSQEPLPELTYTGDNPRVQNPLSPEASQKHIQVPKGFETVLFASEPEIINPIAFSWDEKGRLWVVQSMDYPHGLENEVGGDRITICEDLDGDGHADKFTDFATEQRLSTGIVNVKGGVIVAQAPDMVYLEDTDGDDKMDRSTVLFNGFGTWDTHAGPSSLRYGPDNMIWGAVGYSGFENEFQGKPIKFKMGVYRFSKDGRNFEPVGQFNNNTWGLGISEDFEIFGSTANNNHCCYVGIPLKHYDYLEKLPPWAVNADFIQGHYEIGPVDTIPLQQVDVRGGYTAAAGANFYTARNYPEKYWNQIYVNEPTGHLVHIANIEKDGAGYKEVDGGNIFASTDAWTSPVFSDTGPDGNLWVADWYNPVIQHNPDSRGMDNQVWNDNKGEGNAHINTLRDLRHGRIYIIRYKRNRGETGQLNPDDHEGLINGLRSDNMFWRTTAQRLIVEENKQELIPQLLEIIADEKESEYTAVHALWALHGLAGLSGGTKTLEGFLSSNSPAKKRAGMALIPDTEEGSDLLIKSALLQDPDPNIRLSALLKAGQLPETDAMYQALQSASDNSENTEDKWLNAALKVYYREISYQTIDSQLVDMVIPSALEETVSWYYTEEKPGDDWYSPDYDHSSWSSGVSPFIGESSSDSHTVWSGDDIWLRREVNLRNLIEQPVLKITHDDNYSIYVNGQLLMSESGVSKPYKFIELDPELGKIFKKGKNVIAVHCHDNGGERYIDAGIGDVSEINADKVFVLNTVNQEMAYDQKILRATAGQHIKIVLNNRDEMPHNLVVIQAGSLDAFGEMVDGFLKSPEAADLGYVPNSRYVLGTTKMLDPGESDSFILKVPDEPGRYPFLCTFPGHWRLMQGVLIVNAPGTYIAEDPQAPRVSMLAGGGSHDFVNHFGVMDGRILSNNGSISVTYSEQPSLFREWLDDSDVLYLCNNQPIDRETQQAIFRRVDQGIGLLINHPSTWYNWKDWPEYNQKLVGGGSESHEKFQEFEVQVTKKDHPIMHGVPSKFKIVDELYRWKQDPDATDIEVLAIGKSLETGEEYPVVWTVNHPSTKIVCNTLGHDQKAHQLRAYQRILNNSLTWVLPSGTP